MHCKKKMHEQFKQFICIEKSENLFIYFTLKNKQVCGADYAKFEYYTLKSISIFLRN